MKRKILMFAAALVLIAMLGKFCAKPLLAQVRAALVQNLVEPGRNPYQSTIAAQCTNVSQCVQDFMPVPAGKRLVVTSITGNLYPSTPGVIAALDLTKSGLPKGSGISVPSFLQAGTFGDLNIIGVNAQFTAYFEPGETPEAYILATTNFGLGAGVLTLSGYLISLP